jgi:hypothetical protein
VIWHDYGATDAERLMVMDEAARLSALIGDIYDAALEPALWTGVVERVGRFVGGSAASIFSRDSVRGTGNAYYNFGVDPQYEQLYFEKYIKFDPLNAAYLTLAVGGVPETAGALGIGDATVKTHLGRLFEKTGAKRQADLVKLVAGFSNPLHG